MGLIGMLIREVVTLVSEFNSKKKLENQLGRKVEARDIYSLGANLEAAEVSNSPTGQARFAAPPKPQTALPAPQPSNSRLGCGLLGCGGALLLGLGVILLFVLVQMPESTYNRLNPFTPKPPAGAFPAAIADLNLNDEVQYDRSFSSICACNYFFSTYSKGAKDVSYTLYNFKSEAEAKMHLDKKSFIGGGKRMEQVSDSRFVAVDRDRGYVQIAETAGKNMILISSNKPVDAIAFENGFPFAAFGVAQPPPRSADGLVDDALPVNVLMQEYKSDKKAAKTKYDGKMLLLTGTVVVTNSEDKLKPYLAFQMPGTKPTIDTMLICNFTVSESARVSATKPGTIVRFRGKVNMNTELLDIMMIEDCKFEPVK